MRGAVGYAELSLCHGVAAVDTDVSTGHVARRLAEEIDNGAHEIFWFAHLADGNERGPVLVEFRVFGQDLLGAVGQISQLIQSASRSWN